MSGDTERTGRKLAIGGERGLQLYNTAQISRGLRELADALSRQTAETSVHAAASAGDVETVRRILDGDPAQVDARDRDGWTPLLCAVHHDQIHVVELLLSRGADAEVEVRGGGNRLPTVSNRKSLERATPLRMAMLLGRPEHIELLQKFGATAPEAECQDVNTLAAQSNREVAPLNTEDIFDAIDNHDVEAVRRILAADPLQAVRAFKDGGSPLGSAIGRYLWNDSQWTADEPHHDVGDEEDEKRWFSNWKDELWKRYQAEQDDYLEIIQLLLSCGADADDALVSLDYCDDLLRHFADEYSFDDASAALEDKWGEVDVLRTILEQFTNDN